MTVAELQRALIARGYDLGAGGPSGRGDDGVLGPRTRAALLAFQGAAGLAPSGAADAATRDALRSGTPAPPQDLSAIGAAVLIAREGRRLRAYRDSVGIWTIGVGHTSAAGPPVVTPGLTLSAAESERIFRRDVARFVHGVSDALADLPEALPPHAFDALVSLCFNIGPAAFLRSTLLRRLRAGDRSGAAEAILMWDRPRAILSRRQAEYDQFRTPYATALPRARRSDARPIRAPADAPAEPDAPPEPIAPPVPAVAWVSAPRRWLAAWRARRPAATR